MKRLICALAVLMAGGAIPALSHAAEPETLDFKLDVGKGKCLVKYPRSDSTVLLLLLNTDWKLSVAVERPRWEIVDDKDTNREDYKLTLEGRDGATVVGQSTSTWAGYTNGFNQGVWSGWKAGKPSEQALDLLAKSSVITVVFDGQPLATFDIKHKGQASRLLSSCISGLPEDLR